MSKTVYCYTQLAVNRDGGTEATMLFPQIEVMLALHRHGAMCYDLDGRRHEDVWGFTETLVETYDGWLCMVRMGMTDAGWTAVQAAYDSTNPVVWGWTADEFVDAARARRNQMYQNLQNWRPQVASRLNSLADIRWLIDRVPTDDPVSAGMKSWMLDRIDNGIAAPPLPTRLLDDTGVQLDIGVAKQVWDRWRAEAEGTDYRMLMRLWEFYCLNLIVLNSQHGTV